MIIYVKEDTNQKQLDTLTEWLNRMGVEVHTMTGADRIILGLCRGYGKCGRRSRTGPGFCTEGGPG